jgi:hypothetical protein
MNEASLEAGSFRDRSAHVFHRNGEVLRALSPRGLRNWEALASTAFFERATANGALIPTERLQGPVETDALKDWAAVLRHERLPFVSYPYEWSFGMLRDAALLQLDLLLGALDAGLTIKDATPYNVQWKGTSPVFIDIGSFEGWPAGEPWVGYRQFCEMFLYPLLLAAYCDVPFQPWLRGSLEGIDAATCKRLLGVRALARPGVFPHVYLQARAQAAYDSTRRDVRDDLRAAGFGVELIKANVRRLRRLVAGLRWTPGPSAWSDYAARTHYPAADAEQKRAFVRDVAMSREWGLVWDLGCNTGSFSRIAAERAKYVVALDADHVAVERLYQDLKADRNGRILPLVGNVADPSPDLGWRHRERRRLSERGRPDLVLCLALVHHLLIGANIPMDGLLDWLYELGGDLVIEFVTRDDSMVQGLLRNREDQYSDYDQATFERCLSLRFTIAKREALMEGRRILYYARRAA